MTRDLVGYGRDPPAAAWPGGARVAVNIVINVEEGSEPAFEHGDGRSETALTESASTRVPAGERDLAAESMYEYGARAGVWRLVRMLEERRAPATIFACAVAVERNPELAAFIRESGWDVCCHGLRWIEHWRLSEAEERAQIAAAIASLEKTTGLAPRGWYCRYGPSLNTRRLLIEHGGFDYDSDSYADDLPFWIKAEGQDHLIVPYSLVTNDAKIAGGVVTATQMFELWRDAFDVLRAEGRTRPKLMSVGLHPRLVGHPARAGALGRFLDHVEASGEAWLCRRIDVARHWRARFPAPGG